MHLSLTEFSIGFPVFIVQYPFHLDIDRVGYNCSTMYRAVTLMRHRTDSGDIFEKSRYSFPHLSKELPRLPPQSLFVPFLPPKVYETQFSIRN